MKKWLSRVRAALTMGVLWAVPWAIIALLIGLIVDPNESMDEMWPVIGAYPGFLGGVLFSVVLSIAERHRKVSDLSVPRFGVWGAVAGLLIGVLPFVLGTPAADNPRWLPPLVIGTITVMGAVSAAGSLALAKRTEDRMQKAEGRMPNAESRMK